MANSYCMMCGKEKKGIAVREDHVLGALRWFKRNVTRDEKGNRIVVCRDCYSEYKKRRGTYESRQKLYLALGVMFVVVSLLLSPKPLTVLVSALVLAMVYLFSLMSYVPKIGVQGGITTNK